MELEKYLIAFANYSVMKKGISFLHEKNITLFHIRKPIHTSMELDVKRNMMKMILLIILHLLVQFRDQKCPLLFNGILLPEISNETILLFTICLLFTLLFIK